MQSPWDQKSLDLLIKNYPTKGKMWCVRALGMKEHQVRYKAALLGLRLDTSSAFYRASVARRSEKVTGRKRPGHSAIMKRYAQEGRILNHKRQRKHFFCSQCKREFIKPSGKSHMVRCCSKACAVLRNKNKWSGRQHPRGMLGKKHKPDVRAKLSIAYKKQWADPKSTFRSEAFKQRQSDSMIMRHANKEFYNDVSNAYSRCKAGWWENDDKRYYMRSSWEHNYAWYLEWLKARGDIKDWEYEPDTFWFEKIKRGARSYLPDFKVFYPDGSFEYHEVKGWLNPKSKTKLARMEKYYPDTKLVLIDKSVYNSIKKWGRLIPGWE